MTPRTKSFFILALAAAALNGAAVSGCGVDLARAQSPAPGDGGDVALRIGAADNGGAKQLRVGDQFEMALPENPSTGYRWQLHAPIDPALAVEGDSYAATAPGLIGSGGLRNWRFRALKQGAAHLVIDYRRSWEPAPVESFAITIDVRAK
ncbi:MAG: protease inhibitor I42 family protein [Methylocella sp.]